MTTEKAAVLRPISGNCFSGCARPGRPGPFQPLPLSTDCCTAPYASFHPNSPSIWRLGASFLHIVRTCPRPKHFVLCVPLVPFLSLPEPDRGASCIPLSPGFAACPSASLSAVFLVLVPGLCPGVPSCHPLLIPLPCGCQLSNRAIIIYLPSLWYPLLYCAPLWLSFCPPSGRAPLPYTRLWSLCGRLLRSAPAPPLWFAWRGRPVHASTLWRTRWSCATVGLGHRSRFVNFFVFLLLRLSEPRQRDERPRCLTRALNF